MNLPESRRLSSYVPCTPINSLLLDGFGLRLSIYYVLSVSSYDSSHSCSPMAAYSFHPYVILFQVPFNYTFPQ